MAGNLHHHVKTNKHAHNTKVLEGYLCGHYGQHEEGSCDPGMQSFQNSQKHLCVAIHVYVIQGAIQTTGVVGDLQPSNGLIR